MTEKKYRVKRNKSDEKRKTYQSILDETDEKSSHKCITPTTSEISRSIHTMIKEHTNRLSVEEQALVRRMSIEEIEGLLGFHAR